MHYGLAAAIREQREHFPAQLLPPVRGQTGPAARLIERGDLDWLNAVPASPATGSRGNQLRDELVAAAAGAMEQVRERFGVQPSDWQWGKIHRAHWLHPFSTPQRIGLDIGPESVDGGVDTLRNTCLGQPAFSAASGAEYRLVERDLEGTTILESTGR
jgi:penicillin amidase